MLGYDVSHLDIRSINQWMSIRVEWFLKKTYCDYCWAKISATWKSDPLISECPVEWNDFEKTLWLIMGYVLSQLENRSINL